MVAWLGVSGWGGGVSAEGEKERQAVDEPLQQDQRWESSKSGRTKRGVIESHQHGGAVAAPRCEASSNSRRFTSNCIESTFETRRCVPKLPERSERDPLAPSRLHLVSMFFSFSHLRRSR